MEIKMQLIIAISREFFIRKFKKFMVRHSQYMSSHSESAPIFCDESLGLIFDIYCDECVQHLEDIDYQRTIEDFRELSQYELLRDYANLGSDVQSILDQFYFYAELRNGKYLIKVEDTQ